ncbi:hypothetical protein JZ751_019326 [Albula glossodonta]|uniref:Uncharacterized protein n=1 Tax=Albula glossodonta TaxID=121402 RepID=A0A8T2N122_9TELE|nr:hypothetical protein JZ751_019326 [Albula glossodonta]
METRCCRLGPVDPSEGSAVFHSGALFPLEYPRQSGGTVVKWGRPWRRPPSSRAWLGSFHRTMAEPRLRLMQRAICVLQLACDSQHAFLTKRRTSLNQSDRSDNQSQARSTDPDPGDGKEALARVNIPIHTGYHGILGTTPAFVLDDLVM